MKLPLNDYYNLLSRYLRPQRFKVVLLASLIFSGIGLQLVAPQIVRDFIDAATGQVDASAQTVDSTSTTLMRIALLYLMVTLIQQAARLGAAYVTEDVKWRATNWLRNDLSDHCLRLDMGFHNEYTPGAMIERIDGDVQELSNFLSQFILRLAGNGILLLGILIMLYWEDWRIGLAFSLFAVVMFLVLSKTVAFGVPFWEQEREASSQMFGGIEEWLGGTEDLRANGGVAYVQDRLQRNFHRLYVATRKAFLAGTTTWGLAGLLFSFNLALALGMGAYLLNLGAITIGTVYLIMNYSNALQWPIMQMSRELQNLQSATASIARIRELFDRQASVQEPTVPQPIVAGPLSVTFDHVWFAYERAPEQSTLVPADKSAVVAEVADFLAHEPHPDTQRAVLTDEDADDDYVLREVSFVLEPGEVLGLLGRTGSGKTTITRLLFRLYDPTTGTIRLGDRNLRHASLGDIRSRIGMVTQEVQLFQASVRDNLTFFDQTIPDQRIMQALEMLELDEWFASLENGLETRLEAGGRGLSAGQAQLLAFTRVFLKDPGLVIMDEASSRLDPVTEYLIERAVDRLLHNRTGIIVAHRLATVQRADKIMILQDGQIIEHGDRIVLAANPDSHFSHLLRTGMAEVLV